MYSLQQQYNLQPGQYDAEIASLSVLPHMKSIATDLAVYIGKALSVARPVKSIPKRQLKV